MTRIYPGDGDPRHGTYNGYQNLLCSCDACRKVANLYQTKRRQQRPPLVPDDPRHGTTTGYSTHKCRCTRCRKASSAARTRYNHIKKGAAL